jgi:hypothetical protein
VNVDALSEQWQQRVAEELDPGEELVWMGSPDPVRTAGRSLSTPAARVGWVTLATAIGWVLLALQIVGPPRPGYPFPWMVLLPALFPVLAFAVLAWWMPGGLNGRRLPHRADHTLYMVTDRRVVIMEGGHPYKVQSLAPPQLTHMVRRQRPDGAGDLILTREPGTLSEGWAGGNNWAAYAWREVGLFGLADVRGVERLIRERLLRGEAGGVSRGG